MPDLKKCLQPCRGRGRVGVDSGVKVLGLLGIQISRSASLRKAKRRSRWIEKCPREIERWLEPIPRQLTLLFLGLRHTADPLGSFWRQSWTSLGCHGPPLSPVSSSSSSLLFLPVLPPVIPPPPVRPSFLSFLPLLSSDALSLSPNHFPLACAWLLQSARRRGGHGSRPIPPPCLGCGSETS